MLEIAVLGLLNESPMHGYELRKRLSTLLGYIPGLLLRFALPDAAAAVRGRAGSPRSRRSTRRSGARSRRGKRVYRLTAEGKEHLAELLADVGPDAFDDEGFGARLAFFAQTRSDIRLQILEGRRRRVEEQRDGMRSSLARTGERLDRYTRELHEHGLESVDREVRWLTELIEHERPAPPTSGEPTSDHQYRTPTEGGALMGSTVHGRRPIRVAIVGVGNCAASLVQGVHFYRDADPAQQGPGPDARQLRPVPRQRHRVRRRVRRRREEGRPRPLAGDRREREQHHQDLRRPAARRPGAARPHARRSRQVLPRDDRGVRTRSRSTSSRCSRTRPSTS